MPNWCFSSVKIHDSEEKIDRIWSELEIALSSNPYKADFGNSWLGNLLSHIGIDPMDTDVRCRGSIAYEVKETNCITLDTESAWGPHIQCIEMFVKQYSDTATIEYVAEECGCELYWSNSDEIVGAYNVDVFDASLLPDKFKWLEEWVGIVNERDLNEKLASSLGTTGDTEFLINKADDYCSDEAGEVLFSINQYIYVPIGEDT